MIFRSLLAAAAFAGLATAQVTTDCNPMQKTNCPADPALGTTHRWLFNTTPSYELWDTTVGSVQYDNDNFAQFTVAKQGDSPTIKTNFYFFFGRTEIWLKVAKGQGIVSSTMWLSDDLDEVDWEFLGSNNTQASTNYFGKGYEDYHNGAIHQMPGGTQDDFHNYTTTWTKDEINWYIDGALVRTLTAQAANQTRNYPQTPMRLSIGIWAGGDPSLPPGTIAWAGGHTDYAAGPYTMYVKSCEITDYSGGKEYVWGDQTGSYQSIKIVSGNSTALDTLNKPPPQPKKSFSQKWNALPANTKIGIYAGVGGAAGLLIIALGVYCIRQRRLGAKEARLAEERERAERVEMEKFRRDGVDPDSYNDGSSMRNNSMVNSEYHGALEITGPLDNAGWSNGASLNAPPMRSGSQSPRSPVSPVNIGFDFGVPASSAPGGTASPGIIRSASPAVPANMRSESVPPNAYMRNGLPSPKLSSPAPIAPLRSFSATQGGYKGLPQGDI